MGAQKFVRIVAALHAADGMISTIIVACYGGGLLGGAFTAMLFSLAGIPLTVGFIARFPCDRGWRRRRLVACAVFALVIGSVIGLF